jgi:hypothetical protein
MLNQRPDLFVLCLLEAAGNRAGNVCAAVMDYFAQVAQIILRKLRSTVDEGGCVYLATPGIQRC